MPRLVDPAKKEKYVDLRRQGYSQQRAAKIVGIDRGTGRAYDRNYLTERDERRNRGRQAVKGPVPYEELSAEARRAYDDFGYFQERYFGRIALPWQVAAAQAIVAFLASEDREYAVINAPPGSGKSETFTLLIPAWVTVRNRALRGLIGSYSLRQAEGYTGTLRRVLEATEPMKAAQRDIDLGLAVDAVATIADDFGVFKPDDGEIWQRGNFKVEQFAGEGARAKESTWTAAGMDTAFLGGRYDLCVWDDVYDPRKLRSVEARDAQREWWTNTAETRLEPGGVLILNMQRMGPEDLSRFCLDKRAGTLDEDTVEDDDGYPAGAGASTRAGFVYHHIVFKAHYTDRCLPGSHALSAVPYKPGTAVGESGCLLYPRRLTFKLLANARENDPQNYETVYQQEDVDPAGSLIDRLWVNGGIGEDGVHHLGCWDENRTMWELPEGLGGTRWSLVTADPSPTKMWAVQAWVYHPDSESRFLLHTVRKPMEAPDFLERQANGAFTGLLEDWWQTTKARGVPFTHLIVEQNAAQRFMLQYTFFKDWCKLRGVSLVPHNTTGNKTDPKLGVGILQSAYKHARVRLPGNRMDGSRAMSQRLTAEVTSYPNGRTDDQVMAQWFFEHHIPRLFRERKSLPKRAVPSWMRRAS